MKTRNGKIARLPRTIRDQLNQRLNDGEFGNELVAWLNALPEVRQTLAEHFAGRPVSEQNLSEWKAGGYQEWLLQQEALAMAGNVAGDAEELTATSGGPLTDKMAVWLAARYLMAARRLGDAGGEDEDGSAWKRLRELCKDIVALRRGDHEAARLRIEEKRYELSMKDDQARALELCLEDAKKFPDVMEKFGATFGLLKKRRNGDFTNDDDPGESDRIKPKSQPVYAEPEGNEPVWESQTWAAQGAPGEPIMTGVTPGAEPNCDEPGQETGAPIEPEGNEPGQESRTPAAMEVVPGETPAEGNGDVVAPPDQTESDPIKPQIAEIPQDQNHVEAPGAEPAPSEPYVPDPDPEKEAYNRWFRMHCYAEPFDPELLEKLYAAIPQKET